MRFIHLAVITCCALAIAGCSSFKYVPQEALVPQDAYAIGEGGGVTVELGKVPSLGQVGGAALITDEQLGRTIIIARPESEQYVVATSHCTHRGKALGYHHDEKVFRCSSLGGSTFGIDGKRMKGPAKDNLYIYSARVEGGKLIIDAPEGE